MNDVLKEKIDYGKELILVLDDEEFLCETVVEMLRHKGFRANSATNAKEACKKLEEAEYTFLLTDIRMPDINGIDFLKKVKKKLPNISAIAMTGFSEDYGYVEVIKAGATDFINKPFGMEELEAKIRRAIIERKRLEELKRLSITDSLTNLYNQRYFYTRLNEEFTRAKRQKKYGFAVVIMDLDGFKDYNDKHGHLAGDNVLRKLGEIIRKNIRNGVDTGYRYGGDEFAVILIDADSQLTSQISERIRKAVNTELGMDVSIGSSIFSEEVKAPEDMVKKADKQMYENKKTHENCRS